MIKNNYLIKAVLASTLFVVPFVYAVPCSDTPDYCISTATVASVSTSVKGSIGVSPSGSVTTAGTAILMDANNKFVTLDPNNTNASGIAINAGAFGISITSSGSNSPLTIGENTEVLSTGSFAVNISNTSNITIDNAGSLIGNSRAIFSSASSGIVLNNHASGLIQTPSALQAILIQSSTMEVINSGTIEVLGGSSIITSGIFAFLATAEITNNGFIKSNVNGSGIYFSGALPLSFLDNAGTIESNIQPGIVISASIDHINNSGTISSTNLAPGFAVIHTLPNGYIIPGGITTNGIINGNGGLAILLNSDPDNDIPLIVNGGIITGDVLLDTVGDSVNGHVFTMTGGTINGNVSAFGGLSDTLDISGGTITGITTLGDNNDTLNLSGTGTLAAVVGGAGSDTYNISGGSLTSLTDTSGVNILNMSGGLVTGNINFTGSGPGDILNVSGGMVMGTTTLGNNDTLNLSGTGSLAAVVGGAGNDTYNISGGSLASLTDISGTNIFNMSSGIVSSNVSFATNASVDTLNLSGGVIQGTTLLGDAGDTVNLSGTLLQALFGGAGNDIFNVSGGSFTSLNGKAGADTLNVTETFSLNGSVTAIETIHIKNAGTIFTVNQPITGMTTQLTTDVGTSIIFNTNIPALGGGAIQNNGTLQVNNGFTVTDTGGALTSNGSIRLLPQSILQVASLTQNSGGAYIVPIQNLSTGQLQTTTTSILQSGSIVVPQLIGATFIPAGTTFDIIQAAPLGVTDNSTLVQPLSATFSFSKSGPSGVTCGANTCVRLTANRNAFNLVALSDVAQAVGGALDSLVADIPAINQDLFNVIQQLSLLPTAQSLTDALESLAPPFNYGMVAGSYAGMNTVFGEIQDRMDDFHLRGKRRRPTNTIEVPPNSNSKSKGLSYGDPTRDLYFWGSVLGAHLTQNAINHHAGYKADGGGGAIGMDWNINADTIVGGAGSFFKVKVDDNAINPKDESIQSWQTTAYTSFEFTHGLFLDALFGLATNRYELNRIINVNQIHTGVQTTFNGIQYGVQADIGSTFGSDEHFYIAPFARFKYVNLDIEDYSESSDIGLMVENHSLNQSIAGVGVNITTLFDYKILWEPILTAMIGYDFNNKGEQPIAAFIGGGPLFTFEGIKPGQLLFDLDIGLNASFNACSTLTLKYQLELRDNFVSFSGYVQYAYLWS